MGYFISPASMRYEVAEFIIVCCDELQSKYVQSDWQCVINWPEGRPLAGRKHGC